MSALTYPYLKGDHLASQDITSVLHFTFLLLVVFQFKQYLADFPLQRQYMLTGKVQAGWDFVLPLAIHCTVHATLTLAILLIADPRMWWLCFFDFVMHFTMDRIKSSPMLLGRYNNMQKAAFWNCLGLDQTVHHLTHYFIIWTVVKDVFQLS